jgi:CheY-like chemotaxis protein
VPIEPLVLLERVAACLKENRIEVPASGQRGESLLPILIVDDRPANRDYLVTLLAYAGHRLLEAPDGEVALSLARDERPDLIIADIIMPAMDGYEMARQVRADPGISATQIIFFTSSYLVSETRRLALACGVTYVITKPAEPQTIFDTVTAALHSPQVLPGAARAGGIPSRPHAHSHRHARETCG